MICTSCGIDKNQSEYDKHRKKCKECRKNESIKRIRARSIAQENIESQQCSVCLQIKRIDQFRPGFLKCRMCQYNYHTNRMNTNINAFLSGICSTAKTSAMRKLAKNRVEAGQHNIDTNYLQTLVKEQQGCCYYSNIPLIFKPYSDWKCSLERIDTSKGYIAGNVKLIAGEFQSASQWTTLKYQKFITLLNTNHEPVEIDWKPLKDQKNPMKFEEVEHQGKTLYKCTYCKNAKEAVQFNKQMNQGCKECRAKRQKTHFSTPHGHLVKTLADMKSKSKKKGHMETDLTIEIMKKMIDEQGGLCAYSGIPMTYGSYLDKWWTCSPERINVSLGYTKDNVCFICYEFNTTVIVNKAIPEWSQSSGWSKVKIQYIKDQNQFTELRAKS